MKTYHERVAAKMKSTYMAGSLNSYETILAALHRKFPEEHKLREHIAQLEQWARASGADPNFIFIEDE